MPFRDGVAEHVGGGAHAGSSSRRKLRDGGAREPPRRDDAVVVGQLEVLAAEEEEVGRVVDAERFVDEVDVDGAGELEEADDALHVHHHDAVDLAAARLRVELRRGLRDGGQIRTNGHVLPVLVGRNWP